MLFDGDFIGASAVLLVSIGIQHPSYPLSQDILTPEHQNLINIDTTVVSASENGKLETSSKHTGG